MLLPRKTREIYEQAFRALAGLQVNDLSVKKKFPLIILCSTLQPRLHPTNWMTDFEQAAIGAIVEIFPGVELTGCFFHLCQSLYRWLQTHGLQTAYAEEDGILAIQARSFAALALIPIQHVADYFRALVASPNFDHRLDPFVDYFEVIITFSFLMIDTINIFQ